MEKLFIVANFKSHMTESEAKKWLEDFLIHKEEVNNLTNKQVIIAPSFTQLLSFSSAFSGTNISLAGQNISGFDEGAYTGEINGRQIKDYADYVIIGHSERRNNFNETEDILINKVNLANEYGLKPIYCIQGSEIKVPEGVQIVAYEPIFAIGSGTPDTPENAEKVAGEILNKGNYSILYGGSVISENVSSFTKGGKIKGILVGGASLDPDEFYKIIQNA